MVRRFIAGAIASVCCLVAAVAWSQSVDVSVSSRSIAMDDELQVTYTFKYTARSSRPVMPDVKADWKETSRRREYDQNSTNIQIVNGRMTRKRTYQRTVTLFLQPTRTGRLTIGPAYVKDGQQVLARSPPVTVLVRQVAAMNLNEAQLPKNLSGDRVMLVPEFDRQAYYVGEPFVATWTVYARRGVELSDFDFRDVSIPDVIQRKDVFDGKIEKELPNKRIGRHIYARYPVMRQVWKVIRPEPEIRIQPFRAQVEIIVVERFGIGRIQRSRRIPVKTPTLVLKALSVPDNGRPASYRDGAIGQFSMSVRLQARPGTGRAILDVQVNGTGSLKTLSSPKLGQISGAVSRQLPTTDQIAVDHTGVHGKRVFHFELTAKRDGNLVIPALQTSFFNPKTQAFETASTQPLSWKVKRKVSTNTPPTGTGETSGGTETTQSGERTRGSKNTELAPIEHESEFESGASQPWHLSTWYLGGMAVPILLFVALELIALFRRRRKAMGGQVRAKRAFGKSRKQLRSAETLLSGSNPAVFYEELARVFRQVIADRHAASLTGLTNDAIRARLSEFSYPPELVERYLAELESCDFARFAPGALAPEEMQEALKRSVEILSEMERISG
jgi:hypothetical protein